LNSVLPIEGDAAALVGPGTRISAPWLSVVIPAYRGERWIASALDSLVAQEIDGVEVLVIDGGPTTATVGIARRYSDRLRLRIFERPDLLSWHSKTNFAVHAAAAPHVCWLGVDDVWLPGRAKAVRAWIEDAPGVPLHLAASVLIGNDGRVLGRWRCPLPSNQVLSSTFVSKRLLIQNFVAAPAPVFRRDAWLRCGGLDEQLWYTADWDIWLKLVCAGSVLYHDAPTIGFRVHSGSLTVTGSRDAVEFERQMVMVLERHLAASMFDSRAIARTARASIKVNLALAAAAAGEWRGLSRAAWEILGLGPAGMGRYLRDSRIWERTLPRLRAKMSGSF
jgi:glycosyltransferase involved in cell wall biosynthesis